VAPSSAPSVPVCIIGYVTTPKFPGRYSSRKRPSELRSGHIRGHFQAQPRVGQDQGRQGTAEPRRATSRTPALDDPRGSQGTIVEVSRLRLTWLPLPRFTRRRTPAPKELRQRRSSSRSQLCAYLLRPLPLRLESVVRATEMRAELQAGIKLCPERRRHWAAFFRCARSSLDEHTSVLMHGDG
jgi:hypothetical protein